MAECRCRALQDTGREGECADLLEGVLDDPAAASWTPLPDLAALVVRSRREGGDLEGAARLARRVAIANVEDPGIHQLEIATRSRLEGETAVLEDLERRLETAEGLAFCLQQGRDFDKLTSLSSELGGMLVQTAGPIIQTVRKQGAHAAVIEAEAVAQSEEVDSRYASPAIMEAAGESGAIVKPITERLQAKH